MLMDGESKVIDKLSSERMYSWYFTREELEKFSPSRKDGISESKESEVRQLYCLFLRDVGIRLKLPQMTIATAMMFCHRFYLHQSLAKSGWQTVATVCIFLASKVEDTPCPLDLVIRVAYETMYRRDPAAAQRIHQKAVFERQKALILIGERLVLKTVRFDFNIQHPYKPLLDAMKNLGITQKEVKQVAWNFVNDWLRTTLCLQYKPQYIAAGSLYLAAKLHNVKLPLHGAHVWWHQFDVAPKPLEAVIQQMMELVGLKKLPVASPSPVKQNGVPSESKLLISSSPDSVLAQSSLSRSSSSPDIDGEHNDHLQTDSEQDSVRRHSGDGGKSCPNGRSLDISVTRNSPSKTHYEENLDKALISKHGDGVISCAHGMPSDMNAVRDSSAKHVDQEVSNYDHASDTLHGENSNLALKSRHSCDGVNLCSHGRSLDTAVVSKSTAVCVEPLVTNCNGSSDGLDVGSLCSDRILAVAATGNRENAPYVLPVSVDVDNLSDRLKKVDVPRIKDLLMKRKRKREIQEQAMASVDPTEEAWIERELESGIVTGPRNGQVDALDGLSEDDWIERELVSGIIIEPGPILKKQKIESSCC